MEYLNWGPKGRVVNVPNISIYFWIVDLSSAPCPDLHFQPPGTQPFMIIDHSKKKKYLKKPQKQINGTSHLFTA